MGKSSCRQGRKAKLQKKLQRIQRERDELENELQKCKMAMETQEKKFKNDIRKLQNSISEFERPEEVDRKKTLSRNVFAWIAGIYLSFIPLLLRLTRDWFFGKSLSFVNVISDFVLVLCAISGNLLIVAANQTTHKKFCIAITVLSEFFLAMSLEASLMLQEERFIAQPGFIKNIFYATAFAIALVAILGVLTIVRQNQRKSF